MSGSNCCSWPKQVSQEAGKVIWYSHLFKNFPVCCDTHSQRLSYSQWGRCFFLAMKLRYLLLGRKAIINLDSILKSRDITLLTKVRIVKTMVFPVVIQMWELDHKEGWAPRIDAFKVWCLEKTLEIPLDCKDIKPDNHKGDLSWIFIGRTVAEAKAPILWPLHEKSRLSGKVWSKRRR